MLFRRGAPIVPPFVCIFPGRTMPLIRMARKQSHPHSSPGNLPGAPGKGTYQQVAENFRRLQREQPDRYHHHGRTRRKLRLV